MAPGFNLRCRLAPIPDDGPPARLRLPIIPALIGLLAALNIASVILALIE